MPREHGANRTIGIKSTPHKVSDFLHLAANGNDQAAEFLVIWFDFCHAVDDVIDESQWSDPESILAVCLLACAAYSHAFYVANAKHLQMPMLLATSTYAGSVKWEKPDAPLWKRTWAEVTRHAGNQVICATAMICGGWDHLRKIEEPLLASCYIYHKDIYGIPQ